MSAAEPPTPASGAQVQPAQLAPVAAVAAGTTLWLAALGLITTPYMLHRLGTSAYAIFALVTIITAYLSNLELGFGHATLRFLARAHTDGDARAEARIIGTSLAMFLGASALGAAIALLLAPFIAERFADFPASLEGQAVDSVRLGAILIVLAFLYSFVSVALQALARFRILMATRVVTGTLLSGSAVAMAAIFDDVRMVLLAQAVISICGCTVLFAALARATSAPLRPGWHRPTFTAMAGYGGFVLASGLAYQAEMQGPPTVLAGVAKAAELTAFAVPAVVLQQMALLSTAASTGFFPFASSESTRDDRSRLTAVFRSNIRITLIAMGPVAAFLIVFARELLTAWVGESFAANAADPLRYLAAAGLLIAIGGPAADVARALNRMRWVLGYTAATAALAITGALILAPDSGADGAAQALCFALLATTIPFALVAPRHLLGMPARELLAATWPALFAVAVTAGLYVAGAWATSGFAAAIAIGVVVTALHSALVYRLVLDDRERSTLRAGLSRRSSPRPAPDDAPPPPG